MAIVDSKSEREFRENTHPMANKIYRFKRHDGHKIKSRSKWDSHCYIAGEAYLGQKVGGGDEPRPGKLYVRLLGNFYRAHIITRLTGSA